MDNSDDNTREAAWESPQNVKLHPGQTVDRFIVDRPLGAGSYGDVYQVHTEDGSKSYALKVLKLLKINEKDWRMLETRFDGEYRCGQLSSINLVRSYSKGKVFGNPYIVMDFVSGGDLVKHIKPGLPWTQINHFAIHILQGLHELHKNGIIHRDLKPENVLFDPEADVLKLTDFGIAGYLNARLTTRDLFGGVRKLFGTYAYIAPEQMKTYEKFAATAPVTDIFSFGVMMYELISGGKYPFGPLGDTNLSFAEYTNRKDLGQADDIRKYRPDTPAVWQDILRQTLERDYHSRASNVFDLLRLFPERPKTFTGGDSEDEYDFDATDFELVVTQGEQSGRVYPLADFLTGPTGIVSIGWLDKSKPHRNHIEIQEDVTKWISNFHATIEKHGSIRKWIIRDGQFYAKPGEERSWHYSTNGVFVNGKKVDRYAELRPNCLIQIGDTALMFRKIKR